MKTAQPESLPPGVCGSGGITQSAIASTVRPSSPVKNSHGPNLAAAGGAPALGVHGICPEMVAAPTFVAPNSNIAVPARNSRLRIAETDFFISIRVPLEAPSLLNLAEQGPVPPGKEELASPTRSVIRARGQTGYSQQIISRINFESLAQAPRGRTYTYVWALALEPRACRSGPPKASLVQPIVLHLHAGAFLLREIMTCISIREIRLTPNNHYRQPRCRNPAIATAARTDGAS